MATTAADSALARALALLQPPAPDPLPLAGGYLDLLGGDSPEATGTAQRLMFSGVVPVIYERWWRPGLGRLMKGVFGPSMSDEYRIAGLLLSLGRGDGVLDVGCGPGNFTRDFACAVGPTGLAVGIDASPTMLGRAIADTPDGTVAYVRGDAVRLPFADETFDGACCFAALHMFAEPFEALDHMARVLKPGGRIALLTSCRMRSAPMRLWDGFVGARSGQRMFERDEITGALRQRGFDEISQRVTGLAQIVGARKRP